MRRRFRLGPRAADVARDVEREIEAHLEERAREFIAQGLDPAAAREAAVQAFGDRRDIEAELRRLRGRTVRRVRRRRWYDDLRQDVGLALRNLRRAPLFAAVALATLALGIGASTAVFSVLRSVVLRPLPYQEADRLVQVWTDYRSRGRAEPEWLSPPQLLAFREGSRAFTAIAGYQGWGPSLTGEGAPEALQGAAVSAGYFGMLGVRAAHGREFVPADEEAGAEQVAVLSDGLWRRRFGADRSILGRRILLDGESWTVVGILPSGFRPPVPAQIYRALPRADADCGHGCIVTQAIGRLRPGVSLAQAQADLESLMPSLVAEAPTAYRGTGVWLVPLHTQITGPVKPALLALSGAVLFVMLIACVNLAGLLLVRAGGRSREFGVRAALGAGRARIARQLLTESLVLAGLGGLLGLGLGWMGTRVLSAMIPDGVRSVQAVRPDALVVAFALALAGAAGITFGLVPALHAARPDLMGILRSAGPRVGERIGLLRRGLVAAELAIATVLLVGAGLLLRTFLTLQQTELGFRTERLVTVALNFTPARYPEMARVGATMQDLVGRLRQHPAIAAAELADVPVLTGGGDQSTLMIADGRMPDDPTQRPSIWYRRVSPGYLPLIEAELAAGRLFAPEDRAGSERVAVITEEMARRLWPGENAVGRVAATGPAADAFRVRIVGVIRDLRHDGPREPLKAQIFFSYDQLPGRFVSLVLAPAADQATAVAAVESVLREVDPEMPLGPAVPLEERLGETTALSRYFASTVSAFAGAALFLALLGIYGLMAFAVRQRQREIGVRMALGAEPGRMAAWLMGEGARLTAAGLTVGLGAALLSTRVLRANLHGVDALDRPTFLGVAALLGAAALLACWVPARRARRVDPMVALRE